MMDLDIRTYGGGDVAHLLNIDLKGSEIPYSVSDWQLMKRYYSHWEILIASIDGQQSAFIIQNLDTESRIVSIEKLAVLNYPKTVGLLGFLLDSVCFNGTTRGFTHAECILASYECRGPNDPHDQSEALLRAGFKCEDVIDEAFYEYGQPWEGFVFRKPIL